MVFSGRINDTRTRGCSLFLNRVDATGLTGRAYIQDHGCRDRGRCGAAEFQVHTSADVASLQHGAAPSGTVDRDRDRLRAEHWMPGNQRLSKPLVFNDVRSVLCLDFQHRAGGNVTQVNTPLDFGLHNPTIYGVVQMRVRPKETRLITHGSLLHYYPRSGAGASGWISIYNDSMGAVGRVREIPGGDPPLPWQLTYRCTFIVTRFGRKV